jgi:hypothetical protein
MSIFSEVLAKSGLPEPTMNMIEAKLVEALTLIVENNKRVAQINAAKAQDPNNTEYLDSLWALNATDPEISEIESEYQTLIAESEKLLSKLREFAKTKVESPLSDEDAKKVKALVNQSAPTIDKAIEGATLLASVAEQMLELKGEKLEGGFVGMLPQVESLKNARGRKATTSGGGVGSYMTRVGEILLDGKTTNREIGGEMKGKFNFAADDLSEKLGAEVHEDNRVTAEELEEAYWAKLGKPARSVKSTELPESVEFEFTKTVKKSNSNDDSFTEMPVTTKVKVFRPTVKPVAKVETKTDETKPAEPAKVEAKVETPKVETPAPAKKAGSAPTSQAKK